ncbi:MAG: hypothetical protein EAX96_09555 [Candidatus Lokiarchaeota archaeon]|nr:hypothetical protein [Candidatus Lokiarchaeota archaeon]
MDDQLIHIFEILQKKFHFEQKIQFKKLTNFLISNEKKTIINYFFNDFKIYPETILISSLMFSIFVFSIISLFTFMFNNIIFLIFGFFFSYVVYKRVILIFERKYKSEKAIILSYSDLIFQEFLMIMTTTKSIFDAIKFVSNGNYPIISEKFKKIIININNGKKPELALSEYLEKQPCEAFKNKISILIDSNFSNNYIIQELAKDSSEIHLEYEKINKELDGKLILIIGFSIFIPMLISLTISFYSLSTNYFILFFFPIYYLISIYIEKKAFSYELFLLGDFITDKSKNGKNFDELITFFSLFSNYLKKSSSPERSFIFTYKKYNGILKEKLGEIINNMVISNISLHNFLKILANFSQENQTKRFIEIISRMILLDSIKASDRIQFIISRIRVNQEFISKRKMIFESQKFKINILCIILNGILGLISAISPLISFSSFYILNENVNFSLSNISFFSFIPIFILLGLISTYSTYYVLKIFKSSQKEIKTSIYFLIFLFVFLISLQIMI